MRTFLTLFMLAGAALLTAGCTIPPPTLDLNPVETRLGRLEGDQHALAERVERLQTNLTLLEARLLDQQKAVEELRRKESAQKVTPAGEMASAAPTSPAGTAAGVNDSSAGSPTEIYLQAFADYASGRFTEAIAGFDAFLRRYPNNDYAGNAQYWLGECYYSRQEYERAAAEFSKVAENYPQAGKVPDALLKRATALRQIGEVDQAQEALQQLRRRYPESPAAQKSLQLN